MNDKKTLKALVLSLWLAVLLLQAVPVNAQFVINRGLLKNPYMDEEQISRKNRGMLRQDHQGGYNLYNGQFGSDDNGDYILFNQTFGQTVPLGSGLLILTAAGAGYALKKRKCNKKL